jgi:uncharacterized membrane protein (UPF0127 family)
MFRRLARLANSGAAGFFALMLLAQASLLAASTGTIVLKTETGDHRYNVEVAETNEERAVGLMYRRSLPEDAGMLFIYDRAQPISMWMKNTLIPLDMIFIAADGTVHRIEAHTEPFSTALINSEGDVRAVLEVNAGQASKIGLKPGDKVAYPGLGSH